MNDELLSGIKQAATRVRPYVLMTPLMESVYFSKLTGANVFFKLESEQTTGSFKLRGATNKVLSLTDEENQKGVITASTGNHGQALARAAQKAGVKCIVFVPKTADPTKVEAIRLYGAEVEFFGEASSDTLIHAQARKIAQEKGMVWVSPYNDLAIAAGQGTIGVEVTQQLNTIDAMFITVGGGGLISGIGTYLKSVSPQTKIIGCLPENSAEMYESIKAGKFVDSHDRDTISDGSGGGFEEGSITYELCKQVTDDFILVSEEEIKQSIKQMIDVHHKIIEGAAGVAFAAFMKQKEQYLGKNVVILLCGANISTKKLKEIL
jgi:threonine dehydratase